MTITYQQGEFLETKEKYLVVLCNCIETQIRPDIEKLVSSAYQKFPYADIYKERKSSGRKGKPGSFEIKGNGTNDRFILNILSHLYVENSNFPNDSISKRIAWFKRALTGLSKINNLESIAFSQKMIEETGVDWKTYLEAIDDFDKAIKLTSNKNVNIVIYESDKKDLMIITIEPLIKERVLLTNVRDDITLGLSHFKKLKIIPFPNTTKNKTSDQTSDVIQTPQIDQTNDVSHATTTTKKIWQANPDWLYQISELPEKIVGWNNIFLDSKLQKELKSIDTFFEKELEKIGHLNITIFPPQDLIFNAFKLCSFNDLKVCIIGQDPYINLEEAMGLSFSVPKGVKIPPSLQNIYKELENDIPGFKAPKHGDLTGWAKQGVLLLNTALTVYHKQKEAHMAVWKNFTDRIIEIISEKSQHKVVFMLWGLPAKKKQNLIKLDKHIVLTGAHPSPLSANKGGWFGNKHFSKANEALKAQGLSEIDWLGDNCPPKPPRAPDLRSVALR